MHCLDNVCMVNVVSIAYHHDLVSMIGKYANDFYGKSHDFCFHNSRSR